MNIRVSEAYAEARRHLRDRDDLDPKVAAAWIVRHLLGADGAALLRLIAERRAVVPREGLSAILKRLKAGEPLDYVLGEAPFGPYALAVGPGVLVPRPETYGLVERVISRLERDGPAAPTVVDLGTGSGAIAVALAKSHPALRVVGVDVSPVAVLYARTNARRLGVAGRVRVVRADMAGWEPPAAFDALVSNPPYIAAGAWPKLPRPVRREPRLALIGGVDGLDFYRLIAARAARLVRPGGFVAVEVGAGQADAVRRLFAAAGLFDIEVDIDFRGIERYVLSRV